MSDYVPLPHERTTEARWRCLVTGNLEYCRRQDRGPGAAQRRLAKSCMCRDPKGHTYRAGFIPIRKEA